MAAYSQKVQEFIAALMAADPMHGAYLTGVDIAKNPAITDGMAEDPTVDDIPRAAVIHYGIVDYSGPMEFAPWFQADPQGALKYFTAVFGAELNLDGLSAAQKKRMGL